MMKNENVVGWYRMMDFLQENHGFNIDFIYGEMMPTWWTEAWLHTRDGLIDSVMIVHKATRLPFHSLMELIEFV
jgi:hypothetical protein